MNEFEFVLLIILMAFVFGIIKQRVKQKGRSEELQPARTAENAMLKDEVRQLKERIQVLERITVEKENSLAKQIDELRDR